MSIPTEVIREVVGTIAVGPAGDNVHAEVAPGATPSSDLTSVETQVDEQSLAAAHARNEGGPNKIFAALDKAAPKGAQAGLATAAATQTTTDNQYTSLFAGRSLGGLMRQSNGMAYQPHHQSHRDLARMVQKNPLLRMRRRLELSKRRTLNEILKRRAIGLNPEMLPTAIRDRVIEDALQKGEQYTPFGPIPLAILKLNHAKSAEPGPAPRAKPALTPMQLAYRKWGHALESGSYIEGPGVKRG